MGLFDLPAPIFSTIDGVLAMAMPAVVRLLIWGVLAGWLTMVVYRMLSSQDKIGELKTQQQIQQKKIAEFDGEFAELMPLIRHTLALGFRQLRFALGPALLASVPVLFIVIWVAGEFGYQTPVAGSEVILSIEPVTTEVYWSLPDEVTSSNGDWVINWPDDQRTLTLRDDQQLLLLLPLDYKIPVIHKKRWWNIFVANPLGYLPQDGKADLIRIGLPEAQMIAVGPGWMRGWMFSFFVSVLLSSIGFKLLLRID